MSWPDWHGDARRDDGRMWLIPEEGPIVRDEWLSGVATPATAKGRRFARIARRHARLRADRYRHFHPRWVLPSPSELDHIGGRIAGAAGDGVTDDTTAVQVAMPALLPLSYGVS